MRNGESRPGGYPGVQVLVDRFIDIENSPALITPEVIMRAFIILETAYVTLEI
jgi:hypothetical protein